MKNNIMIEFVRKGQFVLRDEQMVFRGSRTKKGILIAVPYEDKVLLGWSLCHTSCQKSMGDKFSLDKGMEIATERVTKTLNQIITKKDLTHNNIPDSIQNQFKRFQERVTKYYKDKKVINLYTIQIKKETI